MTINFAINNKKIKKKAREDEYNISKPMGKIEEARMN